MTKPIIARRLASKDIESAHDWYLARSKNLGNDFLQELEASMERIQANPERFRVWRGRARRLNMNRFPYFILYVVEEGFIDLVGCIHEGRDPEKAAKRLS